MTDDKIAFRALLEKGSVDDLARSMGWAASARARVIAHASSDTAGGSGFPASVRRMAWRAPIARRRAVSRTDRISA